MTESVVEETLRVCLLREDVQMEQVTCSLGYVPRYGLPARRERDCDVNCADYEACEAQAGKVDWRG